MSGYYEGITVQDWIKVVQKLNGKCSRLCYGCKKTWQEIANGTVHMKENEIQGRRDCDMRHVFYCDLCWDEHGPGDTKQNIIEIMRADEELEPYTNLLF